MNNIVIDREEFCLEDFDGEVKINVKKLILIIKGHVVIKEWIKNNELDLMINMEENSSLEYIRFGLENSDNKIIINQNSNSRVIFKESLLVDNDSKLKIKNNILGNNNISEIIVRAVSKEDSRLVVDAILDVLENTFGNEVKEDLRGLEQENSKITIIPDMLVASSEVMANHNVTIGSISKEDLFYLCSKGLTFDNAKKLLEVGFLTSIYEDIEMQEKIKEIIK